MAKEMVGRGGGTAAARLVEKTCRAQQRNLRLALASEGGGGGVAAVAAGQLQLLWCAV